ncbi:MAG TPA: SigB/SigF/SigG family RNA polymerase sigma factor [Candidatus Borkfalkia excrementipullorum]|nr:SigB/SigF/SigG family RNA polymerase sigma factor [Candidatus Borkfalkia excrementipullorum]
MLSEEQTARCIRAAKAGDDAAKEALLSNNVSLLKSIVRRYLGKGVEFDDLFQLASMGLLKAIYGFDESFGVRFSTYAVPMIAGEIKRFMRDDGSVKVSRAMKSTAKSMNKFVEEYAAEHGAQPSVKEIAEKFGMEESEAVFVLGSSRMPVSIYEQSDYKDEKAASLADRLPSVDDTDEMIENMQLKSAIEALPEREKKIIILRYFRDMTQSEVAEVIGVSQVQISRIESKVVSDMKRMLG